MKKEKLCMWGIMGILTCTMIPVTLPVEVMASETESAQYEYDRLGRVTKITYQDGSVITYEYDKNGNIVSVKTSVVERDAGGEGEENEENEENEGDDESGLEDGAGSSGSASSQVGNGSGGGTAKGNKDKEALQPIKPGEVSGDVTEEVMQVVSKMRNLLEAIAEFLERIFDTIKEFILGSM